jgi:hypothetical protein
MTATTTARTPARPGPTAPLQVWTLDGDGTQLNHGKPMNARQALEHIRRWDTTMGAGLSTDGKIVRRSLTGDLSSWSGAWPPIADEDALVGDLICDLPLSIHQGDLMANALRAAHSGDDRAAGDLLRELLTTSSTTPREGQ